MEQQLLKKSEHVGGRIKLPGSKSISNRTLLLAALANDKTQIKGLLASDDTDRMLAALEKLRIKIDRNQDSEKDRKSVV